METVQRMRGSTSSSSGRKRRGSRRADGLETTLQAINLSANVPAHALPMIMNSSYNNKSNKLLLPQAPSAVKSKGQRLWFESPRLELDDDQLFPESSNANTFSDPQERWKAVKEQAGKHQQDGSVLILRPHIHSPQVLKCGMPPQAAERVKELHVQVTSETMPSWMDAIVNTFFNLQHLHITQVGQDNRENEVRKSVQKTRIGKATSSDISSSTSNASEDTDEEEARLAAEHSDKLKRLYILYRLPDLISIDGVRVTSAERQLANPDDPNGQRVDKNEWVHHHNRRADLRISLPESVEVDQSVEVDVLMGTPCAHPTSLISHSDSDKSVRSQKNKAEELPSGPIKTEETAAKPEHSDCYEEEKKEDSLTSVPNAGCHEICVYDNTSVVAAECSWTCGTLALWGHTPEKKTASGDRVIRKSSSWKECRKLASPVTHHKKSKSRGGAQRSMRLIPQLDPVSPKRAYKSSSRSAKSTSSMPGSATKSSRQHGATKDKKDKPSRVSTSGTKGDRKQKSARAPISSSSGSTNTNLKKKVHAEGIKKSSTQSSAAGPSSSEKKSRKSISGPFPRTSPTNSTSAEAGATISVLEVKTSRDADAPVPPAPPSSSRADASGPVMETIDFNLEMQRSVSSEKPKAATSDVDKGELPPQCPTTTPVKTRVTTTPREKRRRKKKQERFSKWKEQQISRRTSIMDEEEEFDEESSGSEYESEDDESVEVEAIPPE